mgnify:CR=1 FL=1
MKWKLCLVSLALGFMGCGEDRPAPGKSPDSPARGVSTVRVEGRQRSEQRLLTGSLKVRREATLSSKLPGRILFLKAKEGEVLSAGSVVAEIDPSDVLARTHQAEVGRRSAQAQVEVYQAGVEQSLRSLDQAHWQLKTLQQQQSEARARLELARADHQRYEMLAAEGAIPRQRAEQASTEFRVAQARWQQLQSQLGQARSGVALAQSGVTQARSMLERSYTGVAEADAGLGVASVDLDDARVVAPFRGVVVAKMANQGELNTPRRPLLRIQDLDSLEASIPVPESEVERVQPGSSLPLEIPALKKRITARVRQIISSTDPASRSFEVRLQLLGRPGPLFPGMVARLALSGGQREHLELDARALVQRGQLSGAFVVGPEMRVEFRLAQVGPVREGQVPVLSGLKAGDEVVVNPPEDLQDGQRVERR